MEETIRNRLSFPMLLWTYRIFLIGVGYSTLKGVYIATTMKDEFMDSFPGASDAVYYFFLASAALGFVSLAGLFHFQRWGVVMFGVLAIAVTIVDVIVEAPVAHTLAGVVLAAIILGLAFIHRGRFVRSV